MEHPSDSSIAWLQKRPSLLLLARQWVQDPTDAEDVVQEAFLRFWPRRGRVRNPNAYLFRCVRNTAKNWKRSAARRKTHEAKAALAPFFKETSQELESAELGAQVQQGLLKLSVEQREVIVLRIWSRQTFPAIAEVLEVPLATAKSRYRYALEALRRFVSDEVTS